MKKDFLIDRQGKTFVLYAGLLDEAHERGLHSIETELLQAPSEANGQTTICRAVVTIRAEDGTLKSFSGIGDADRQNVGRNIAPHAIRMAETRAKARALRDAINVGAVALEELSDDDVDQVGAPAAAAAREPTPIRPAATAPVDPRAPAPGTSGIGAVSTVAAAASAPTSPLPAADAPLVTDEAELAGVTAEGKARLWAALVKRAHAAKVRPPSQVPPASALARAIVALSKQIDRAERQAGMGLSS